MTKKDKRNDGTPHKRDFQQTLKEMQKRIDKDVTYCKGCGYPQGFDIPCECSRSPKQMIDLETEYAKKLGGRRYFDHYLSLNYKMNPTNRQAFDYVRVFNTAKDNLYLWGPVGSGKTHLAVIAARKIVESGRDGRVAKPSSIMRDLREVTLNSDPNGERRIIDELVKIEMLVIDDLGTEKDTEYTVGKLYEIIDGRYAAGRGGLIITSNLDLNMLADKLNDQKKISSRLCEMCKIIHLQEHDHRRPNA